MAARFLFHMRLEMCYFQSQWAKRVGKGNNRMVALGAGAGQMDPCHPRGIVKARSRRIPLAKSAGCRMVEEKASPRTELQGLVVFART
jgi:hypothetical protein